MLKQLVIQAAGEEIRRHEHASGNWVNFFESRLQNQFWESATPNSVYRAVDYERLRWQNQESFLSREARRREHEHQQEGDRNAEAF